jgi:SAM-dependent methyltransferase
MNNFAEMFKSNLILTDQWFDVKPYLSRYCDFKLSSPNDEVDVDSLINIQNLYEFIVSGYALLLGRIPESNEIKLWLGLIQDGRLASKRKFISEIISSNEGKKFGAQLKERNLGGKELSDGESYMDVLDNKILITRNKILESADVKLSLLNSKIKIEKYLSIKSAEKFYVTVFALLLGRIPGEKELFSRLSANININDSRVKMTVISEVYSSEECKALNIKITDYDLCHKKYVGKNDSRIRNFIKKKKEYFLGILFFNKTKKYKDIVALISTANESCFESLLSSYYSLLVSRELFSLEIRGVNNPRILNAIEEFELIKDLASELEAKMFRKRKPAIDRTDKLDNFYWKLESVFRGSFDDIKKSLLIYLPHINQLPEEMKKAPFLDIGCGRGEWLEVLRENGFDGIGIDLNRKAVSDCLSRGLNVELKDVFDFLEKIPDEHFSVISLFHVVEHFDFNSLFDLLFEIYRVMKKDGYIIIEMPNIENLVVSCCQFYLDPSHINKLHGALLSEMLQFIGITPYRIDLYENFNINPEKTGSDKINYMLNVQPNFSVIGKVHGK